MATDTGHFSIKRIQWSLTRFRNLTGNGYFISRFVQSRDCLDELLIWREALLKIRNFISFYDLTGIHH